MAATARLACRHRGSVPRLINRRSAAVRVALRPGDRRMQARAAAVRELEPGHKWPASTRKRRLFDERAAAASLESHQGISASRRLVRPQGRSVHAVDGVDFQIGARRKHSAGRPKFRLREIATGRLRAFG